MSQDFFTYNLGKWVMRTLPNDVPRTFYIPNDYKWVKYLYELQEEGVKFAPVIHSSANVCTSCEA